MEGRRSHPHFTHEETDAPHALKPSESKSNTVFYRKLTLSLRICVLLYAEYQNASMGILLQFLQKCVRKEMGYIIFPIKKNEALILNDLARHILGHSSKYALFFEYHVFDISKRSYFLSAISHGVQVPGSLSASESSPLSYFWPIFLIQPEFPHSLSPGLSAGSSCSSLISCTISSPEAFKPSLSTSTHPVPFQPQRGKEL